MKAEIQKTLPKKLTIQGGLMIKAKIVFCVLFIFFAPCVLFATSFDWLDMKIIIDSTTSTCINNDGVTSGITVKNPQRLAIEKDVLKNSGHEHSSFMGEPQIVSEDSLPYSHKPFSLDISAIEAAIEATVRPWKSYIDDDPCKTWRLSLCRVALFSTVGGSISLYRAYKIRQDYKTYAPGDINFDNATLEERQYHLNELSKKRSTARIMGWSLIGFSLLADFYLIIR